MPTLYDSYQLANSRMIPEYVGSTLPELRHANASRQEQFNVGKEYADMIDQAVKTATASSYDQPVLDQLKEDYRDRLKGYAEKGDYENMWRNVAMDARDFVGKYKPIAQNQQNISKHFSELEDRVAKGEVSKSDYEAEVRRVQDTYTGLQKDLATGQYKNQFSGKPLVKAPDFIAKINAILTNTHAIERGWKVTGMTADNDYVVSNGGSTKTLPWKSVKQFIDAGMAIDPDVQSYVSQQKELAPYKYGFSNKISEDQAMNAMTANKTPAEIVKIEAARQGRSWKDTLKDSLTEVHLQNLQAGIYGLGQKGIIDQRTSERGQTISSVGADRIKRDEEAPIRFLVPGSDTRLEEKDKDLNTLNSSIGEINKSITELKDKLATAPENEKKLIQSQITRQEDMLSSKRSIIHGAQEATARKLGYKSYEDYLTKIGVTKSSQIDELGTTMSVPTAMSGSGYIAPTGEQKRFEAALETEVKTNAANYAFKPLNMSLTEEESKQLKNIVVSQPNAFQWFKPGSTKVEDAPKDFDINQIQVMEKNGVYYLQANGKETSGKSKGAPSGDIYTVAITPGSNIGVKISQNLVGRNRQLTPEMARAAATLSGYTFNGDITNLQNNESFIVRDPQGNVFATVKREPYVSTGGSRYVVYDQTGAVLKKPTGDWYEANDADQISQWLQESLTKAMQAENKKK